MQHTADFIPPISEHLEIIKNGLHAQLEAIQVLLQHRNFISQQITETYDALLCRVLRTLQEYFDKTLPDLLDVILYIANLMRIYDSDLDTFLSRVQPTLRRVEWCIGQVDLLVRQHSSSISALFDTTTENTNLVKDYKRKAESYSSGAVHAGIASAGLYITGAAATTVLFTPIVAPFTAVGTVAALSVTSGGISGLIALFGCILSADYVNATLDLNRLQDCSNVFQGAIEDIYKKLSSTAGSLGCLKNNTEDASTCNDTGRQSAYKDAQEEAKKITDQCREIGDLAIYIAKIRGKLTYHLRQIPAAAKLLLEEKTVSLSS